MRESPSRSEPPPLFSRGALAWLSANLFSSWFSSAITIVFIALGLYLIPPLVEWATVKAVWSAPDGALCRQHQDGACWAFIWQKLGYLGYGSYPEGERWRVNVVEIVGALLIAWLLWPGAPGKKYGAWGVFLFFPVFGFVMLVGADSLGLMHVDTLMWGGVFVSLIAAIVGIVASLPLGVMLALGRRSQLPAVRLASVIYIEFVRGVPFITVLFMADNMLPLFLPPGWGADRLLRPLVGVAMFSAAYMAEEVRGGLQALSRGQYEGAMALGLDYWRMMRLVVLPQALALGDPGHRQQLHRPVQGYDAGCDRRRHRLSRRDGQCIQRHGVGGPDAARDRLRVRGGVLFCVLLRDVSLFEGRRAALGGRAAEVARWPIASAPGADGRGEMRMAHAGTKNPARASRAGSKRVHVSDHRRLSKTKVFERASPAG